MAIRSKKAAIRTAVMCVALGAIPLAAAGHALAATASEGATEIEEVVVTAQKRVEDVQKIPIAITVISAARLEQGNIDQPVKLQFNVPSMTFGNDYGYSYITLRGVGNDDTSLAEPSVATYQDGVYTGALIAESLPSFDLQRVEVLRGPQGSLYGRNADGGVINYITKDPSFEPGAYASASYGNYDATGADVGVTGPIVADKIAARFSLHYSDHEGYYDNIATNEWDYADRDISGRAFILLQPTDHLKIIVRGDMAHDQNNDAFAMFHETGLDGFTDDTLPLGVFSEPASYFTSHPGYLSPSDIAKLGGGSIASYYGLVQPGPAAPNPFTTETLANGAPSSFKTDSNGASVTIDWDAGSIETKSISAYRFNQLYLYDDSGAVSDPTADSVPYIQNDTQLTQEFDVSGKAFDDKLDWLIGAFYLHDDGYVASTAYFPNFGEFEELVTNIASPSGSPYAYNLNVASLVGLNQLPGVIPNSLDTVVVSGPGFGGSGSVTAGQSNTSTAFVSFLQRQQSQSVAGFFQATYHITDTLRVTGGFRFTQDNKTADREFHSNFIWDLTAHGLYEAVQAGLLPPSAYSPSAIAAAASSLCHTTTSAAWSAPTGMIEADYDAAPNVLTYAKTSWGYKAGGMDPTQCHDVYNPEYLTDYEGGLKAVFDDGQILTNLAVYYYDYTNIQFTTYVEAGSEILNAGSATAFGTELEYQIQPHALRGWELDGSASFEDSHYGAGCFGDPANLDGAASLPLGANGLPPSQCPSGVLPVAQIKGNELIRAPRWKTNVGLQYGAELGATGNLLTRVEAAWTDTIYNDVWNGRIPDLGDWTQPGYWILNSRLVWTSMDKRYSAEVFGEKLTNSIYATNRVGFVKAPNIYNVTGQLGAPRTFGVKLTLRFGSATG